MRHPPVLTPRDLVAAFIEGIALTLFLAGLYASLPLIFALLRGL